MLLQPLQPLEIVAIMLVIISLFMERRKTVNHSPEKQQQRRQSLLNARMRKREYNVEINLICQRVPTTKLGKRKRREKEKNVFKIKYATDRARKREERPELPWREYKSGRLCLASIMKRERDAHWSLRKIVPVVLGSQPANCARACFHKPKKLTTKKESVSKINCNNWPKLQVHPHLFSIATPKTPPYLNIIFWHQNTYIVAIICGQKGSHSTIKSKSPGNGANLVSHQNCAQFY